MTTRCRRVLWLPSAVLAALTLGLIASAQGQPADLPARLTESRRVFVPAEDLDLVVERDRRGALLSKQKFNELLKLARDNAERNPVPNAAIVLTQADYQARIVGDQLLLTVTAELNQFVSDWQSVTFAMQRLAVEQATLDDEPAMLGRNQDGSVALLTGVRGKHTLKLELSTELNSLGSDQVAAFSLLKAPSGTLSLTLPAGKRLLVGALQLERPAPLDQAADYKIAIGGAPGVQLRITDRAAENAADALTFATTGYGLHVAPGEVTWHALTTLQVFGKPIDRLTMTVPSALEIADVESTGLESWDLSDDPNDKQKTVITLTFGQAFDGSRKISLKGVMAVETGQPWAVPPLSIANITSHIGQVVVQHPAGVRLRVEETEGVRRATHGQKPSADMPDEMAKLNATEFLRFDVWQPDFVLRLSTEPKQREVQTAVAAVLDVNATGLDLQALITVKTRFAPLFELDVRLPADWTMLSAQRDNTPLKWQVLPQEAGINQVRILFDTPLATDASSTVRLALRRDVEGWPVESEPITVDLPELFLTQSNLSEGTFVIRGDDDLDLAPLDLQGLDTVPLKADFERLRFQSQDTRYAGKLKVTRKPSRISVQSITVGRLDPQTVHTFIQAMVEVQGGGVRTLKVALPESTGTDLRFQSNVRQIIEQKPGPVQNGERIWTLQFDQRVRGVLPLYCDIELPRGQATSFVVPQARFLDAERQNGFQAVEAGGEQRLTIDAKGVDGTLLSEVDPLDVPPLQYVPKERIVAVYQNVTAVASVTLSEEQFDKLAVPTAICPLLEVTSVLGQTGELQHRADFRLTAVGVQGLRVTLPPGTLLWATLVDGRPVEVRRQGDIYLVPLDRSAESIAAGQPGTTRQLQLFYRSEVSALTQFGTLQQPPPELSVQTGQGTSQPVDVLDQRWQLHYPQKTLLVESHGPLEPQQRLDETSLIGQLNTGVRIPTLTELAQQAFAVIVTLGVIAFLVLAYRSGRLLIATVIAFGLLMLFGMSTFLVRSPSSHRGYDVATKKSAPTATPHAATTSAVDSRMPQASDEMEAMEKSAEGMKEEKPADQPTPAAEPRMAIPETPVAPPQMEDIAQMDPPRDAAPPPVPQVALPAKPASQQPQLALLSLAIDLTPPEGSLQKSFRYTGADPARGTIALQVDYVDERSGKVARIFLVALVVLIGWCLRNTRWTNKIAIAALGLTMPLALLPLVPHALQVVLDGIFFGMLLACGLWLLTGFLRAVDRCCCSCCNWWNGKDSSGGASAAGAASLLAMLLLGASQAQAQPDVNPNAGPKASSKAPGMQAPVAESSVPHETLVVPYDAGTDPLAADRILLPFDKFVALYRQAYPDKPLTGTPPVDGGIVQALYSVKIVPNANASDDSIAEITARYAVRSYVNGQWHLELPVGAVAWREAKVDGKNAALMVEGVCSKVAIVSPGLHVIDAVMTVPARLSGTTGSFTLPLAPVPSGKLSLVLPAKDLSVRINGSSTVFRRVTQGEVQSIELPVDKGGDLAISWQPEQAKGAAAAVVHVDSVQAILLTDAGIRVSTGFQYRVRQGGIADVTFSLPAAYRLQAVNGPDVGGWELQGADEARKLRVMFRRNITDTTQLTVEAFLDSRVGVEAAVIDIPQLAPHEVTNEIGLVAVYAPDQFSLRAETVESLAQIDADKFSTTVPVSRPNVAPQLAYRFSKRPYQLSLRASRQESQANVLAQQASFVTLRKQQLTTRFVYNLTGAPRSSFTITLPAGYVVLDVKATGLHDWSVAKQGAASTLTIDLNGPRLGQAEVVLTGTVPRDNASADASLEFPRPLDATKLTSIAAVWLDEGFTGTLDTFNTWRSVDAGLVHGELQAVRPNQPVQFAFQSTAMAPAAIVLKLQRATPRLAANGLAMVSVTDVAVIHTLALQWSIHAATTDTLVFTTPSFLAGKLEFTGQGIRETTHSDAGNGRTRWTISLRTPIRGDYFVAAVGTLPPPTDEIQAPSIVFERGGDTTGQPVEGQRQYVLLINLSQSQLTSASPELTESVQREDVPVVVDQSLVDQATELVSVKQLLTAPRWTRQTYVQTPGAPASVNVADLTSIISRDGTYRGQAIYTIKNRSRQFLALRLPANAVLMSVFVGNQPSRAVTTKRNNVEYQLIALPKTSAASLSFPVRVLWRGQLGAKLPKSARLLRQDLDLPAPAVVSQQEDPDFGIPVAKTRWTVWLPDDLDAQPLRDPARHNLSTQPSGQQDLIYEKAAVQELSELLGFVEQNYTGRSMGDQSRNPGNNLRQLGLAMSNVKQLDEFVRNVDGDEEFKEQRKVALKRLSDLEKSVTAQPIVTTAPTTGNGLEGLSSVISNNGSLGNNAAPVLSNTLTLYNSNAFGPQPQSQSEAVNDFSFTLNIPATDAKSDPQAPVSGKPAAKGEGAAAGLETREKLRRDNDDNVTALNRSINEQKAGQQALQSQLAQQPNGRRSGRAAGANGPGFGYANGGQVPGGAGGGGAFDVTGVVPPGQGQAGEAAGSPANGLWLFNPNNPQMTGGSNLQFSDGEATRFRGVMPSDQAPAQERQNFMQLDGFHVVDGVAMDVLVAQDEARGVQQGQGLGTPMGWSQAGGLSLGFDLPSSGKKLVFSKAGGDPKLALAVRPRESIRWGLNLVWSIVWAAIGVAIALAASSTSVTGKLARQLPIAAAVLGVLGFVILPRPLSSLAFAVFVVAAAVVAWIHRRTSTVN